MGQKLGGGGCALCSGGSWVPIEQKVAWAEAYLRTKCHLSPSSRLATTDIGRKLGGVPLWGGWAGSPSNTMWPGPSSTCMKIFILIRQTVWPQYTNVTDRQTERQTDRTVQDRTDRQRSDSIEQTVLQTVTQKWHTVKSLQQNLQSSSSFVVVVHQSVSRQVTSNAYPLSASPKFQTVCYQSDRTFCYQRSGIKQHGCSKKYLEIFSY